MNENMNNSPIPLLRKILKFLINNSTFYIKLTFFIVLPLAADSIEWEKVPGATSYQFQVVDKEGIVVQENKDLTTTQIALNEFPIGKYKYKLGVVDKKGNVVYGDWVEFDIDDNSYKAEGKDYPVHLEWDAVPDAKNYFVEITTLSGKMVKALKTKTNQKDLQLKIGKYQYRTSVEKKGVKLWSDWKEFEVKAPEEPEKPFFSPRGNAMWRSAILPGWGQFHSDNSQWRAWIYSGVFFPMLAAYGAAYQENISLKKEFTDKSNTFLFLQLANQTQVSPLTLLIASDANSIRGEINGVYNKGNILGFSLLALYVFNLADSYFFTGSGKEPKLEKSSLQFQFYSPSYNTIGGRDSVYGFSYSLTF